MPEMAKPAFPEPTAQDAERDLGNWKIVTARDIDGRTVVYRVRINRPDYVDFSNFRIAVTVNWPYESDTGFPGGDTKREMDRFEEAVAELTWHNGFAEMVQVATGLQHREWLFYTVDRDLFMRELNASLGGHAQYPLTIQVLEDPDWSIWAEVLSRLPQLSPG